MQGIRFAHSSKGDYLWKEGDQHTWMERLHQMWGQAYNNKVPGESAACSECNECMVLPVNNGNEEKGKSLVVDFETNVFEGTLLVRIRHSNGTTPDPYDDTKGYFQGMNRRFQVVIQGSPKMKLPISGCMTGAQLRRPCGKLPPKWILKGALKVLSFFAPQLQVKFDCAEPSYLMPLGSTPQMLRMGEGVDMEPMQSEPTEDEECVLGRAMNGSTSLARARGRKKAMDRLFVERARHPLLDPSRTYTMEFLQHLFKFEEFTMELGNLLGAVDLKEIVDGQPFQIMALTRDNATGGEQKLWSFDLWHEGLMESALRYDCR